MIDIVLYEPEIPPNTGNIIRLCANSGCKLHLIEPLGFDMDDKRMRRAGLDYQEFSQVTVHPDLASYCRLRQSPRVLAISTRGKTPYHRAQYEAGDALLFGPETRGLPDELLDILPTSNTLRIPMRSESRSLNLSNAVALVAYEALRQLDFPGLS
ncbi:MAG: tRNA (cytidine(34)-2'-O)-methyltransferase [Pseudomonadota bacterium]